MRDDFASALLVLFAAAAIAIVSARGYAGSWNDGSRLATVESIVDYHTLAIDRSIFVRVPSQSGQTTPSPYPIDDPTVFPQGTLDKLLINGRFYSDKSPVPAVLMAGVYQVLQWGTGLKARDRPDRFCYWLTLGSSGAAYVIAVWSIFQLAGLFQLPLSFRLALTASFGLATVALTYTRHVNGHILLLAVASALLLGLARLADDARAGRISWMRLVGLGSLAGLGYSIDLGTGPILLACTLGLVAYRCRRLSPVGVFVLAALPWLILHHAINYAIGSTFRPANAVSEYLQWPGSPFTSGIMTGVWGRHTVGHFPRYTVAMMVGKRGFLGHNLPLLLLLPAAVLLVRRRPREYPEIVYAICVWAVTWLTYALLSNNYSGLAASIRWFVPLLAPGYFVLAVFLRDYPHYRRDFLVLSAWGTVVAWLMWWKGPWMQHMVPFYWLLVAAALLSWVACSVFRRRRSTHLSVSVTRDAECRSDRT